MADTSSVNYERWSRACIAVGVGPDEGDYRRLRRAWRGIGRHYHTLEHLAARPRDLARARHFAGRAGDLALALWFHAAVYRSGRRDKEARSAARAADLLRAAPTETVERIRQMILDTRHREEGLAGDTALVADVDLSILGQPPEVYSGFERAIRREYWWVPRARYVAGRVAVLERFLARSAIYPHDHFYQRYESRARGNLTAELARLTGRCG